MEAGRVRAICVVAMWIMLGFFEANAAENSCKTEISIASGRQDGLYFEFVDEWQKFISASGSELCLLNKTTDGSVENLGLINLEEVDFAIIQGDIGHHSYYGKNGYLKNSNFLGVRPLFREYLQIVVRADIGKPLNSISSLQGATVAAGSKGSGGYWNAVDILRAANLHEGFDYQFLDSPQHPIESLRAGRSEAAIYTSARPHKLVSEKGFSLFKYIHLSESSSKHLSVALKKSYYDHGLLKIQTKDGALRQVPSVGVQAYLVVSKSVNSDLVLEIYSSLERFLEQKGSMASMLTDMDVIEGIAIDEPFEMHPAIGWLGWNGVLARVIDALSKAWFFVFVTLITLVVIVSRFFLTKNHYDSVGVIENGSLRTRLVGILFTFSKYAVGLAVWFAALIISSRIIVWQEDRYAGLRGIASPLEGFGVIDSTIWLVKTAFTTLPTAVPWSPVSSILIPATVLLGVGAFLHPVHVGFSAYEKSRKKNLSGGGDYSNLKGHVLVCGWNERTPGIIYSLISKYTPQRKQIVVVANVEGDSPLLDYGIDSKLVSFVSGNAVDTDTLRRAGATNAKEAVIVACDSLIKSGNKGSIPVAVALRNLANSTLADRKQNLFICAELANTNNEEAFKRAGVDCFVKVEDVTNKVVAASIISPGISDFIIDLLSFDDHYEIYSEEVENIAADILEPARINDKEFSSARLRDIFSSNQIQLFGRLRKSSKGGYDFNHCNSLHEQGCFEIRDRLVFFSIVKSKLTQLRPSRRSLNPICLPSFKRSESDINVLILSSTLRSSRIEELIDANAAAYKSLTCDDFMEQINSEGEVYFKEYLGTFTHYLILAEGDPCHADACLQSLLITQYLNRMRENLNHAFQISVEIKSHKDRELYQLAGADDVLISNSLIERLLTKMVFNHGLMYEVLDHVTTLDNGNFLQSYTVRENDEFNGVEAQELFRAYHKDYQVIGWKPVRLKTYLESDTMGISSHWLTAFDGRKTIRAMNRNPLVDVGDELMFFNTSGTPFFQ